MTDEKKEILRKLLFGTGNMVHSLTFYSLKKLFQLLVFKKSQKLELIFESRIRKIDKSEDELEDLFEAVIAIKDNDAVGEEEKRDSLQRCESDLVFYSFYFPLFSLFFFFIFLPFPFSRCFVLFAIPNLNLIFTI